MKNGKIDTRSVGITIVLSIAGACIGFFDFSTQKTMVMDYITKALHVQPAATVSFDASALGFAGVIICVVFVAIAMYSCRCMA